MSTTKPPTSRVILNRLSLQQHIRRAQIRKQELQAIEQRGAALAAEVERMRKESGCDELNQ